MKRFSLFFTSALLLSSLLGCSSDEQTVKPSKQGKLGETCLAANDCGSDLACFSGSCVQADFSLKVDKNECFRIECTETADCCANFEPSYSCELYKDECAADSTSTYCDLYDAIKDGPQCVCQDVCEGEQCVTDTSCKADSDCTYAEPLCVNSKCVECETDGDCSTGDKCMNNSCIQPCVTDEQCPRFYTCNADTGECAEGSCSTDKECVYWLGNPRAVCSKSECSIPCETDAECNVGSSGISMVCESKVCVDLGCSTDEECRAFLDLENESNNSTAQAVCRAAK
jgi:hypothetical protein